MYTQNFETVSGINRSNLQFHPPVALIQKWLKNVFKHFDSWNIIKKKSLQS